MGGKFVKLGFWMCIVLVFAFAAAGSLLWSGYFDVAAYIENFGEYPRSVSSYKFNTLRGI